MKYIIKNRGDTMSNEINKELSDFDYSLIQAAIEQYDQEKYDTETVDTLKKYAPYDVSAAWRVAKIYQFGLGDRKDYLTANYWLQIAADMNDAWAQFCLASNYHLGRGTRKNYKKAFMLYNKAVSQGYVKAFNNLGALYLNGLGTDVDKKKAIDCFEHACQNSDPCGFMNLARCYEQGIGVSCDLNEALRLYKEAARLQHPNAEKKIIYLSKKIKVTNSPDDILAEIMSPFSVYHLGKISEKNLCNFFRFLLQTKDKYLYLSNNLMIHCDDPHRARTFIDYIAKGIKTIDEYIKKLILENSPESDVENDSNDFTSHYMSEHDFLNSQNILEDDISRYNVFVLYDCRSQPLWNNDFTESFIQTCEQSPDTSKIITAPEYVIQNKFKENSHLYYRVFRNHIYISDMSVSEVYSELISQLENRQIPFSSDFTTALHDYVYCVYPKADLKNDRFISDLLENILVQYYASEELSDGLTTRHIPYYRKTKTFEEAIRAFDDLTGLESVKEVFAELQYMIQESGKSTVPALHMAFVGNPGTGKTTVAQMTADLLYSMGVIRTDKVITVSALDLLGKYVGQTSGVTRSYCEKAYGGILFIDEAYLISPSREQSGNDQYRQECIGTLLQEMENNRDRLVVIFAGYPKEMDDFLHNSNSGFASRLYKVVPFEDYSDDQLMEIFDNFCKKDGYSLTRSAREKVRLKLVTQRYSRDFGNARTVRNVFIDAKKNYRQEKGMDGDRVIESRHITLETTLRDYQTLSAELNSMIGLNDAKSEVQRAIATCRFSKESKIDIPISRHMLFLGNAGTGKSTVAGLFCQMLFSIGAAKSPNCVSIAASDLIGRVNSVEALKDYCTKAFGGVLFIDEAYELSPYCIPVLLDIMEKERDNITVILAGYDQEMDLFLNQNQGLKSRFPVTVHFDDYSISELTEIFLSLCEKYKFTVSDDGLAKFIEIITKLKTLPNFGNARTVRNIFEQSYRKHAVNFINNSVEEKRFVLDAEDIVELF